MDNENILKITHEDLVRSFECRWTDFKEKYNITFGNPKAEAVAKEYLWQGFLMGIQYIQEICSIDL